VNSIYRVSVPVTDYQELDLTGPPLSVAADRDGSSACFDLWFEHRDLGFEPDYHHPYPIWVFGTGHPVPWTHYTRYAWVFLGTVVTPSGLVWHVFTGHRQGEPIPV
jgi:hypothetical protein